MAMDKRKFRILQAIIDDYILTAMPVGSRTISKKYDMGLSSATIRNEMSDLEELGYLAQPHISAGRIPSAKAYRLYVDQLIQSGMLQPDSPQTTEDYFEGRIRKMEDVINHAAQVLSSLTHYTAVVTPPTSGEPRIRNLQIVPVTDKNALVVIVTDAGIVKDAMIEVDPGLSDDSLYALSKKLTAHLAKKTFSEALEALSHLVPATQGKTKLISGIESLAKQAEAVRKTPAIFVGGTHNILNYPEYSDIEKARSFLSLIETREKLAQLIEPNGQMAFTVRIGPEMGISEMEDLTVVTATYSTGNEHHGTIGVIGPTRMQYQKVLTILSTMGRQLSELLGQDENK